MQVELNQTKEFTKGEIDRLGNSIRQSQNNIETNTLEELQRYRTSHNEALSKVFKILCIISKKVDKKSITTFRIKRFQSIIGKLQRYDDMRLSRMWDIAGCRCILQSIDSIYKIKKLIRRNPELTVIKEYDYIKETKEDGYKSLHLFIKHINCNTIIEIQLRTFEFHNWATLVEISDLLFDSKLKEYGENKELLRFHLLLSNIEKLSIKDKLEIAEIIKKYNYWQKLSNVFARNYLIVRKRWVELEDGSNHRYFLIETNKDEIPKIQSYSNPLHAENEYFNIYKQRQNANIVLTYLQNPVYSQISIAYSNYILTFHSFLSEFLKIFESLIVESLKKDKYISFKKFLNTYNEFVTSHIKNLHAEIVGVKMTLESAESHSKRKTTKEQEWVKDINNQIYDSNKRSEKLRQSISSSMPKNIFKAFVVRKIISNSNKKHQKIIDKILTSQN